MITSPSFDAAVWAANAGLCSHSDALACAFLDMPFPSQDELEKLRSLGIDPGEPVPLRIADVEGAPHILMPIMEGGQWVDVLALRSRPSEPLHRLCRVGWALGADFLTSPVRLDPDPIRVFRHPLAWLQAAGAGVVLLDYVLARATLGFFEGQHLMAEDAAHADELRRELRPKPLRPPRISHAGNGEFSPPLGRASALDKLSNPAVREMVKNSPSAPAEVARA